MDDRRLPPDTSDLVAPTPQYPRPDDTVMAREEVNNKSFVQRTSYDPGRFQETFGTLMQYVTGTPIRVTYYRQILPDDGEQTAFGDTDFLEHDVHHDLEQILNFEMRPESQFNFSWDSEQSYSTFTGEAIVYPAFEPHVGDMFVYRIHDATGLFQVTHIEPLSIRHGAYHRIGFVLRSRLTERERRVLLHRSKSTVVFDLQKCLSENLALLKYESYLDLEKLREVRISLAKHYNYMFYDHLVESYMSPDGVYDPYLVAYMLKKTSTQVVTYRPRQCILTYDYPATVWSLFTEDMHSTLSSIHPAYEIVTKKDNVFGTQFNGLINKPYIRIVNSTNATNVSSMAAGSRVSTGYMNGTLSPAVPGTTSDSDSDDSAALDSNTWTVTFSNTKGGVIRETRDATGRLLESIFLPDIPDPTHDPELFGPYETTTEVLSNGNVIHKHYYYYTPGVHHGHHHTTFKHPPCTSIPPCTTIDTSGDGSSSSNGSIASGTAGLTPYVFSWAFYKGMTKDMSTMERLVYEYLTTGVIDAHEVVLLVSAYRTLTKEQLYYRGAVYLHLIDVAIRSIT